LLEKKPGLHSKIRLIYNPVPCLQQPTLSDVDELREAFGVQPRRSVSEFSDESPRSKGRNISCRRPGSFCSRLIGLLFRCGKSAPDRRDQEYYGKLRLTVGQSGMKHRVFFIEHQREVEKYLAMMDVVVVASQGPEAFPQILIEAMSWVRRSSLRPPEGSLRFLKTEDWSVGRNE